MTPKRMTSWKREITYKEIEIILMAEFLAVTMEVGRKENIFSVLGGKKKAK